MMRPPLFHSTPPRLAGVLCCAVLLGGCRHHVPVTRHFLRMPAEDAGGLSAIQRARWLKSARRGLPPRKTLAATGYLSLPGTTTSMGKTLGGLEMLHVPGNGGGGGIAVVLPPGENVGSRFRLHLLEHQRFLYMETSGKMLGVRASAAAWRIDPAARVITGYDFTGNRAVPAVEVRWDGSRWYARGVR